MPDALNIAHISYMITRTTIQNSHFLRTTELHRKSIFKFSFPFLLCSMRFLDVCIQISTYREPLPRIFQEFHHGTETNGGVRWGVLPPGPPLLPGFPQRYLLTLQPCLGPQRTGPETQETGSAWRPEEHHRTAWENARQGPAGN